MTPRSVFVLKLGIIFAFLVSTILSPGVLAAPIPFTEMGLKTRNGLDGSGSSVPPTLRARDTNFKIDVSPSKSPTRSQSDEQPKTAVGDHDHLTDDEVLATSMRMLSPEDKGRKVILMCDKDHLPAGKTHDQCLQEAAAFAGSNIVWPAGFQLPKGSHTKTKINDSGNALSQYGAAQWELATDGKSSTSSHLVPSPDGLLRKGRKGQNFKRRDSKSPHTPI
ncbi:hypothetical protein EV360DRAFT_69746 [Lentinula raphanica]|nr:hypothetical protein EV360DRAFT_69746 [Lentinula raphanica]